MVYTNGADPNWLLVSPTDSLKVANFAYVDLTAGVVSRTREANEGTLYNKVETYISPFGTLSVVTDRFISGANAIIEDGSAAANGDGFAFLINTDQCLWPNSSRCRVRCLPRPPHADRS